MDDWTSGAKIFEESAKVNSATVAAGDVYVVKTNERNYGQVRVGAITNGIANTASTALTINLRQL